MDAGHKRAQPIVMTTVAMVAGMLRRRFRLGSDGSWNPPMGVTVIGGLILSTLLTLIIVPADFQPCRRLRARLGPLFDKADRRGERTPPTGQPVPAE